MRKLVYVSFVILAFAGVVGMPLLANYQATKFLQKNGYHVISTQLQVFQVSCFRDKHRLKVNFKAEEGNGYVCITVPFDLLGSNIHLDD